MGQTFEIWARAEIARLTSEAATLERALAKFLESQATAPTPSNGASQAPTSKSGWQQVVDVIRQAGPKGLPIREILTKAEMAGVKIKPNTIRSQVWHAKQPGGRLMEKNHRYVWKTEGPGEPTPSPPA